MSDTLDSFEIDDGERSIRFGPGRLDGFYAGELTLRGAEEAEIHGPSGKYRLLSERDAIRLVLPNGGELVRYVKNLQFRLIDTKVNCVSDAEARGFETSYPTPMVDGSWAMESGIMLGGPVNSTISPGFRAQAESEDGASLAKDRLSVLTMCAAATLRFALSGKGRAERPDHLASHLQTLSTALSDSAVIVAILRAFFEVRSFIALSGPIGYVKGGASGSEPTADYFLVS